MKGIVICGLMLLAFGAVAGPAASAERTINIEGLRYYLDFPTEIRYVSRDSHTVRFASDTGLTLAFTRLGSEDTLLARASRRLAMLDGRPLLLQQTSSEYRIFGFSKTSPQRLVYFYGMQRPHCGVGPCRFEFVIEGPDRTDRTLGEIGSFVNPLIASMNVARFEGVPPGDPVVASASGAAPTPQDLPVFQPVPVPEPKPAIRTAPPPAAAPALDAAAKPDLSSQSDETADSRSHLWDVSPAEAYTEARRRISTDEDWLFLADLEALKQLPPEISRMKTLESLLLNDTGVTDISALAGLPALKYVWLDNTGVTGISALAGLPALEHLSLNRTGVTDISALAGLPALKYVSLDNTGVTDISALAGLSALEHLSLDKTGVTDISALAGLPALEHLSLDNTGVTDISALAGLPALEHLSLGNTGITDVSALADLTALRQLSLWGTAVTDFSVLAGLTALEGLSLGRTAITDVSVLAGLIALEGLRLDDTGVTDVSALARLTALEYLSLANTGVTDLSPLEGLAKLQVAGVAEPGVHSMVVTSHDSLDRFPAELNSVCLDALWTNARAQGITEHEGLRTPTSMVVIKSNNVNSDRGDPKTVLDAYSLFNGPAHFLKFLRSPVYREFLTDSESESSMLLGLAYAGASMVYSADDPVITPLDLGREGVWYQDYAGSLRDSFLWNKDVGRTIRHYTNPRAERAVLASSWIARNQLIPDQRKYLSTALSQTIHIRFELLDPGSPEQRATLLAVVERAALDCSKKAYEIERQEIEGMKAEGTIIVPGDRAAFRELSRQAFEDWISRGEDRGKVLEYFDAITALD